MKKRIHIAIVATSLFLSSLAHAQMDMELRDQVRQMVETNAELLARAKDLVSETNSTKARILLKSSVALQEESTRAMQSAEEYYAQSRMELGRRLMMKARDLASSAREAILRTIATARRETRMEETAQRSIERAGEALGEALGLYAEYDGPERGAAGKIIEESQGRLSRARDNMREHMYDTAYKLSQLSMSLTLRAAKLMKKGEGASVEAERELARTAALLERLRADLENDFQAQALDRLERAIELQKKARRNLETHRFRLALQLTRRARRLALEAMRVVSQKGTKGVERELELTESLLERAEELISEEGTPQARRALEEADKIQAQAWESYSKDEFALAMEHTKRARRVLRRALGSPRRTLEPGRVKEALSETDELIARSSDRRGLAANDTARDLLERAGKHQRAAWAAFEKGDLQLALARTRLARRLAARAGELLANEKD